MRKVLFISLAILLVAGVAFAYPVQSPGHGDKLGQGGLASDPHKIFRLVRYVGATNDISELTLTADSVVVWDCISDDGITVTTSTTSGDNAVAGIVPIAILTPEALGNTAFQDIGKRNWGWLQTYGLSSVAKFNDSAVGSAGASFGVGNQKGLAGLSQSESAAGLATAGASAGFIYDAVTASATDVEVFLKCD